MKGRNLYWVVGVLVLVLVVGLVLWTQNYNSWMIREWGGLQQKTVELDTSISTGDCDFIIIGKSAADLKVLVDGVKTNIKARQAPPALAKKRFYFGEYLDKTSGLLSSISINCSTWSAPEMAKLDQAASSMRDAQSACALAIGTTVSRRDIFAKTAKTFNKMRQSRKAATAPKPSQVIVVANTPSSSLGTFSVAQTSETMDYFNRMRSLLAQYKRLRGDLNRARVSERAYWTGGEVSEFDRTILVNAKARRKVILAEMDNIPIPAGCFEIHDTATGALSNGIAAIDALLCDDPSWTEFHERSNNGMARKAYRAFGL